MLTSRTLGLALRDVQQGRGTAGPLFRYLLLLLLLTPLLAGIRLLIGREAPPPEVQIVTQIVEVPQPVYIEVPVPTVVVITVPADSPTVALPPSNTGRRDSEPPAELAAAPSGGLTAPGEGSSSSGVDPPSAPQQATNAAGGNSATVPARPTGRIVAAAPPAPPPVVAETAPREQPTAVTVAEAPVGDVEQGSISYAEPIVDPLPVTGEVTPTPVLVTIAVTSGHRGGSSRSGSRDAGGTRSEVTASTASPTPTSTAAPPQIAVAAPTATATPKPKPTPKKS